MSDDSAFIERKEIRDSQRGFALIKETGALRALLARLRRRNRCYDGPAARGGPTPVQRRARCSRSRARAVRHSPVHCRIRTPNARRADARRARLGAVAARRAPGGAALRILATACHTTRPRFIHGRGTLLVRVRVPVGVEGLLRVGVEAPPRVEPLGGGRAVPARGHGLRTHLGPKRLQLRAREVVHTMGPGWAFVVATRHPRQVWPRVPV